MPAVSNPFHRETPQVALERPCGDEDDPTSTLSSSSSFSPTLPCIKSSPMLPITGGCRRPPEVIASSGSELQDWSPGLSNTSSLPPDLIPNLGPQEDLGSLASEFKFNDAFVNKVQKLRAHGYDSWRRVRGDGNCFYRAVGFGLLEQLVAGNPEKRHEWSIFFCNILSGVRFDNPDHARDHDLLRLHMSHLDSGMSQQSSSDKASHNIFDKMSDPRSPLDLAFIRAMRHITMQHLLRHAGDDIAGVGISFETICVAQGYADVADFCHKVVLPEGVEAQDVVLNALPLGIGVHLRIAFLDRNESTDLTFCDYGSEQHMNSSDAFRPCVHVQFRPGHYDLLYLSGPQEDTSPNRGLQNSRHNEESQLAIGDTVAEEREFSCSSLVHDQSPINQTQRGCLQGVLGL